MKRLNLLLIFILAFQVFMVKAMADDELSPIACTDFEEDYHRVNEAIHGAHMLAELEAGYEVARVLAAIAWRADDIDAGYQARHVLNEWGLPLISYVEAIPKTSMQRLLRPGRKYTSGILMLHMSET